MLNNFSTLFIFLTEYSFAINRTVSYMMEYPMIFVFAWVYYLSRYLERVDLFRIIKSAKLDIFIPFVFPLDLDIISWNSFPDFLLKISLRVSLLIILINSVKLSMLAISSCSEFVSNLEYNLLFNWYLMISIFELFSWNASLWTNLMVSLVLGIKELMRSLLYLSFIFWSLYKLSFFPYLVIRELLNTNVCTILPDIIAFVII